MESLHIQLSLFSDRDPLDEAVDEAIAFLRQHCPPEGYFVGFSGGKDSIVTLELCRMAGVKHEAWYSCTRIDPPEVVRFIKDHYPDVKWAYPKITFWDGIVKKMPPMILRRWCCDHLKKYPTKHVPLQHRVMGIRAEESSRRAKRGRIDVGAYAKQTLYKPIFHWEEWMVWEFIERRALVVPSTYDAGFDRIGCVICPFTMRANQRVLERHMLRWPGMFRAFEAAVRRWYTTKERHKVDESETFEDYMAAYYRGFNKPGKHTFIRSVNDISPRETT